MYKVSSFSLQIQHQPTPQPQFNLLLAQLISKSILIFIMKFATFAVAALLPLAALGAPAPTTPEDAAPTNLGEISVVERGAEFENLEKRAVSGTVQVDGLHYRKCPRTSCAAVGQYAKGHKVSLSCYTRTNTTPVNGDK
jgi:hypothetical protein